MRIDNSSGTCLSDKFDGAFCTFLQETVCGCDGHTYTNPCWAHQGGTSLAYGGPCRPLSAVPCSDDSACSAQMREFCVSSPGVCVHASFTSKCGGPSHVGCVGTTACISDIADHCAVGDSTCQGYCVFTTGATCDAPLVCRQGELCLPSLSCKPKDPSTVCPRVCVRP